MEFEDFFVSDAMSLARKASNVQEQFTPKDAGRLLEIYDYFNTFCPSITKNCDAKETVRRKLIDILNGGDARAGLGDECNAFYEQNIDTDLTAVLRMRTLIEMAACHVALREVGWDVISQRRADALGVGVKELIEKVVSGKPSLEQLAKHPTFLRQFAINLKNLTSALQSYPDEAR